MLLGNSHESLDDSDCYGPFRVSRGVFQVSIRQLLIAIFVAGLALTFRRFLLNSAIGLFWIWMLAIVVAAFWLGNRAPLKWRYAATGTIIPRVAFAIWGLFVFFLLWARHRWLAMFWDERWPRSWPYPDGALLQFHDWLDATFSAPYGHLKITGEVYTVLLGINAACYLAAGASAVQFGFLFGAKVIRAGSWVARFGRYIFQEWKA